MYYMDTDYQKDIRRTLAEYEEDGDGDGEHGPHGHNDGLHDHAHNDNHHRRDDGNHDAPVVLDGVHRVDNIAAKPGQVQRVDVLPSLIKYID